MAFLYTLTFRDAFTREVQRRYEIVGADYTTARSNADLVLAAAQNLTQLAVVKESLAEINDIANVPTAESNVDVGVTYQFALGPAKKASVKFPHAIASVVDPQGNVILTEAQSAAFTGLYTGGNVLLSDGESATDILKGTLDK